MDRGANKKYSKISRALKFQFLKKIYYECMNLKDAAKYCRINNSTAKIIVRNLSKEQKKFVKKLMHLNQISEMESANTEKACMYEQIQTSQTDRQIKQIEIVSRTGFNFFTQFTKRK